MSRPMVRTDHPGVYRRGAIFCVKYRDEDHRQRSKSGFQTLDDAISFKETVTIEPGFVPRALARIAQETRQRGMGSLEVRRTRHGRDVFYARFRVNGVQERHHLGVVSREEAERKLRVLMESAHSNPDEGERELNRLMHETWKLASHLSRHDARPYMRAACVGLTRSLEIADQSIAKAARTS